MSYESSEEVINDYEKLLETDEEYHDVIIYAGQNDDVEAIYAHSIVLRARSRYFRKELSKNDVKRKDGKFILEKTVPSRFLKIILKYIYCGKVDLANLKGPEILKLLTIVEIFNIQSLILCIQEHLAKHQDEFLQQNEKLLESNEGYDVIIHAGRSKDFKAIHAHSFILHIKSQYFRSKLSKVNEKVDGKFILKESDISPRQLPMILRYIYCEKIDLTNLQDRDSLKLLIAVTELNIQPLIPRIQEYLINQQYEFLRQNPMEILENTYHYESLSKLWEICLKKICDDREIFNSDKFIRLKAPLMELLLKRDDLPLEEIDIWHCLIKWGLAQHSGISQDATKWNSKQVTIMEKTLHRCISLIRFYEISSADFFYKVLPYKELLPKQLVYKISEFHMVPEKKLNIDKQPSIIVEKQHFALFASWIDRKNNNFYNIRSISYNFNLLYRASRDGFDVASFHNKCDNKGATIIIAKMKETDQIFGGYNPLVWDNSGAYKNTSDSFIYLITDKKDLSTTRIGRVKQQQYAIFCRSDQGPTFGGGHDLYYANNQWYCNNPHCYSLVNLPHNGTGINQYILADDYEVFQVIRK